MAKGVVHVTFSLFFIHFFNPKGLFSKLLSFAYFKISSEFLYAKSLILSLSYHLYRLKKLRNKQNITTKKFKNLTVSTLGNLLMV